jgi:hypothetical protein
MNGEVSTEAPKQYSKDMRARSAARALALAVCVSLLVPAGSGGSSAAASVASSEEATARNTIPTPVLIERAVDSGRISRATGYLYLGYALVRPARLPEAFRSDAPYHGTVWLLKARRGLGEMPPGPQRKELRSLLLPSEAHPGPGGVGTDTCDVLSVAPMPNTIESEHFYIEYDASSLGGGLTIQDYIDSLEGAWVIQVDAFDWADPPVYPPNPAPNDKYHVRIDRLGPALYGYVSNSGTHAGPVGNNPHTPWNDQDADASCMGLNQDYDPFPGTPQQALDATTAHEFNHSVQFGYGGLSGPNMPDDVFIEGGATWMEDEVYDDANDNYNYLWPQFDQDMGSYEESPFDGPYEYWITFRGLTELFGAGVPGGAEDVMQRFWELTSRNVAGNLTAMRRALAAENRSLKNLFHAYAIAVKFNRPCTAKIPYPFCFQEGPGYVQAAGPTQVHEVVTKVGRKTQGELPDNYSINWIRTPDHAGRYRIRVVNTSNGGRLRASVVCLKAAALEVTRIAKGLKGGAVSKWREIRSGKCQRVVVVITNHAQTEANPAESQERSYSVRTSNA